MKNAHLSVRVLALLAGLSLASGALAANGSTTLTATGTVPAPTVQISVVSAAAGNAPFGSSYAIPGVLSNSAYTYGPEFLVMISYTNVTSSVQLTFSGAQQDYNLAYHFKNSYGGIQENTLVDAPFNNTGTGTGDGFNLGAQTNAFIAGRLQTPFTQYVSTPGDATRFAIGARSTPNASVNLNTVVTLTATAN